MNPKLRSYTMRTNNYSRETNRDHSFVISLLVVKYGRRFEMKIPKKDSSQSHLIPILHCQAKIIVCSITIEVFFPNDAIRIVAYLILTISLRLLPLYQE